MLPVGCDAGGCCIAVGAACAGAGSGQRNGWNYEVDQRKLSANHDHVATLNHELTQVFTDYHGHRQAELIIICFRFSAASNQFGLHATRRKTYEAIVIILRTLENGCTCQHAQAEEVLEEV